MLIHIDQNDTAERVHNAWLRTIEDGVHTYDIFTEGVSKEKAGTKEFANAVVARLGRRPAQLKAASYSHAPKQTVTNTLKARTRAKKELVGIDVFHRLGGPGCESLRSQDRKVERRWPQADSH